MVLFADDAGAANYVDSAIKALTRLGASFHLYGEGPGVLQLDRLELAWIPANELRENGLPEGTHLVVTGASSRKTSYSLSLIDEARSVGVPSIALIDANQNLDWRFRGFGKNPLSHAPDWLTVPDQVSAQVYENLGFPSDRIRVCGYPHYDQVRSMADTLTQLDRAALKRKLYPGAKLDQPIILFASSGPSSIGHGILEKTEHYTLPGVSHRISRSEIVAEEVLAAIRDVVPRAYTVYRHHPTSIDLNKDVAQTYDQAETGGLPLEGIVAADLVIGMTTMLLHEAVLCGRPVLSVIPDKREKNWLTGAVEGLIPCVWEREALRNNIQTLLDTPSLPTGSDIDRVFPPNCIGRLSDCFSFVLSSGVEGR